MQEHRIAVARTARFYTLGDLRAPAEVWFVLHGYGQLAGRFLQRFAALDDGTRLLVAPEGLSRFYLERSPDRPVGASWMTKEDRLTEIGDYLAYLDALHDQLFRQLERSKVRVTVCGFSQGVATAARWVALGAVRADRLILWGGDVPPDLDLEAARPRLGGLDLQLVYGTQDEYFTPKVIARDDERLRQAGIPFRVVTFEGRHEIDIAILRKLAQT